MKKTAALILLCAFIACNKKNQDEIVITKQSASCDFGITNFDLTKRPAIDDVFANQGKGGHGNGGGGTGGGGTGGGGTSPAGVILLDFDGQTVSGTDWNTMGTIYCAPANLSGDGVTSILNRVINDYSPFNVIVTTDESIYNAAPISKRMRVIITETWEWFGQAGGTSFIGSFTWGNNTPCFVFSSLLGYNEKKIGEAASHEAGHTFGLRHQAVYSGTTLISQYNYGTGSGEIGWAPIMGCSYNQNLSTWHNGPNTISSTSFQDDAAIIASVAGSINDDYSNTTTGAASLTTSLNGVINSSTDIDFFSVNLSYSKTFSVIPFNVGTGNNGANVDFIAKIYNSSGQLISTINDPSLLQASTILSAGQYYISVSSIPNAYATTYGMRGKYSISLD